MLVVIKKKVKDNDEASNRLLQMAAGYASASIAITALSPMIFAAFRKKIENYVGGNTTSVSETSQSLQADRQVGEDRSQSLRRQSTNGSNSGQNLADSGSAVQQAEQIVTGTEGANIRVRRLDVETNN
ncbi:hypothetical protein CAV_0826 [Campylobacter avium LMG 24591]|uniref:Uncharacterized protein n=1 Tax=Campylobacter avium LMG 24591 TaxID=522484 RepID=A0A222MXR1_9BACT|nr:hypothetical protein [Campylobacter avium]ASQ30490.1 hypothetical protein CAV_0826 [Campylobacter avium LMG 24591]OYD79587.1 hypothetical protein CAV8706_0830 [Campylobacter avium]